MPFPGREGGRFGKKKERISVGELPTLVITSGDTVVGYVSANSRFSMDMRLAKIDYVGYTIPVLIDTKDGVFIARYNHSVEAGRVTGINPGHINAVCHGNTNRKTVGGFVWKFEERNS